MGRKKTKAEGQPAGEEKKEKRGVEKEEEERKGGDISGGTPAVTSGKF